ncbi:MAG: DUF5126 domain-containing protein [Pedobacter sp.]|nr:MAG: DUF5126 domain-containing protein [Pedobacter sp.]
MKKLIYLLTTCLLITMGYGCSKEEKIGLTVDPNAPAPTQVTDVKVKSQPGGAILTYKLPVDPNLSYIKAVYEIRPGIYREAKSSIFTDTLTLVGYGDVQEREVKIFSVGKNQKESEPLSMKFTPLTPAILSAFETLKMNPTFGGVSLNLENIVRGNLTIKVIVDSTGLNTWAPVNAFYTSAEKAYFAARGLKPVERKFGVYLEDRWNNRSDTLIKDLTPFMEELITKETFKEVKLPGDTYLFVESYSMPRIWDNKFQYNIFATPHTSSMPQWFTFDMGKKVVISRFKEWQYHENVYSGSSVKRFELWGSNNPDADGGWNNWELLGRFNSFKPSGSPQGVHTQDDVNYAINNGEDFEMPVGQVPAVRYLRFKTLETFSGGKQVVITELSFWGQVVQ